MHAAETRDNATAVNEPWCLRNAATSMLNMAENRTRLTNFAKK